MLMLAMLMKTAFGRSDVIAFIANIMCLTLDRSISDSKTRRRIIR